MRKKDLWIIFGAVCAALALMLTQLGGRAVTTGSWGLSFQHQGHGLFHPERLRTAHGQLIAQIRSKIQQS